MKLLIVSDPIISGSVQLNLIKYVISNLKEIAKITVYSTYIDDDLKQGTENAIFLSVKHPFIFYRIYRQFYGNNESVLWLLSWFRETVFHFNSKNVMEEIDPMEYDIIINIAQTIPAKADIYWGQSIPLDRTLKEMRRSSLLVKAIPISILSKIGIMDRSLIRKISSMSKIVISNSRYTKSVYEELGITVSFVVYSAPILSDFRPSLKSNSEKYVLAYIGKETEIKTVLELARDGINVVAFGSKIPAGTDLAELKRFTKFLGFISKQELINLYSGALFTIFPFHNEPLGMVSLESIACGTPVLTYFKEGPSETVQQGISGWLAKDKADFIQIAKILWVNGTKMEIPNEIQDRARDFSTYGSDTGLKDIVVKFIKFKVEPKTENMAELLKI
jgi:glycosyltransferase involved in cell wall biosynthesis